MRVYAGMRGGKRRYVNKTVHGTKRKAERVLTKMLSDRDQGSLAVPTRSTLAEYLERWKESSLRGRVSARTFHTYGQSLERYILEPLGDKRLTSVEPWDIQRIYQDMQTRGLSRLAPSGGRTPCSEARSSRPCAGASSRATPPTR